MAVQTQAEWFASTDIGKAVGELFKEIEWLQETNRELLASLADVVEWIDPESFPHTGAMEATARAVIAKATGKE